MNRGMKIVSFILLCGLILAACTSTSGPVPNTGGATPTNPSNPTPGTASPTGHSDPLAGSEWHLVSMGKAGSESPVVSGSKVTLKFEAGGQAGGTAGCNSYGSQYTIEDSSITFTQTVSTLMACVDDQIMQQEQGYLQALNSSGKFEQAGDELRIEYNKGTDVLIFKKGIPGS